MLASFFSQPASQLSLGNNPFLSAPMAEVPNVFRQGSTGVGGDAESLLRGRQVAPSGMVPRPPQEDVIPSPLMSVSVASGSSVNVPGPLHPSLGQVSDPVDRMHDQSRVRGATGITLDKVNPLIPGILPEGLNIKSLSPQESFWKVQSFPGQALNEPGLPGG